MTPLASTLETAIPGLYATRPESLPFAPEIDIRAFVLERPQGNLLIYASPALDADREPIEALGGVARQYLGHGHEAMFLGDWRPASLFVHEADAGPIEGLRGTWSHAFALDHDFEAIPIPGHTPGSTAFLWDSGRHRVLFTGDSVYLRDGEWATVVLDSSDAGAYRHSLEVIRELDFDVLAPWGATGGQPFVAMTSRSDARRRIDRLLSV